MNHALRLAARGGQRQLSRATFTTASVPASPCSDLRTPLPGAYREPTELWHNDSPAEGASEVEVSKPLSVFVESTICSCAVRSLSCTYHTAVLNRHGFLVQMIQQYITALNTLYCCSIMCILYDKQRGGLSFATADAGQQTCTAALPCEDNISRYSKYCCTCTNASTTGTTANWTELSDSL